MTVLIVAVSLSIFNVIAVCNSELAIRALYCQFNPFDEMCKNAELRRVHILCVVIELEFQRPFSIFIPVECICFSQYPSVVQDQMYIFS